MKILNVVGARPNFMKIAPIHREMGNYPEINPVLVHTGQHYDEKMSKVFFEDLELPKPDFYLGVGSGSHAEQTANVMIKFEKILLEEKPDVVGLAVPGMPLGSPGMEVDGADDQPYDVIAFSKDGSMEVFASYQP